MNNKSFVLVLILCGLIISASIVRDGQIMLLALPFLIYLIIGLLQAPSDMVVAADRIISKPSLLSEELFEIRILISNRGASLVNLFVNDMLFPSMTIVDG